MVIESLAFESQLTDLRHRRCRTKLAGQMEESETSSKMERDFPQRGGTGCARERKEKHLDRKLLGKLKKKKPKFLLSEGMAEDAKVYDGVRTRLKNAVKQLRKAREKERAAKELQEEMQRNVEEARERVLESEENLCRELVGYLYSWENQIGRPHNLSTKIWQMMQSNDTKSDNLENDVTEVLKKTHQLGWNETAKSIRVWA